MFIGCWIVIGAEGIWFSPFDKTFFFKTKKDALADVRCAILDTRENPKTKRYAQGEYIYTPKCIDDGKEERFFKIVRITKFNAEYYQDLLEYKAVLA